MSDEPNRCATPTADCWAAKPPPSPGATDKPTTGASSSPPGGQRFTSFGALLSAFIASSWCWLPPLLILGGISGAGMTTVLTEYRPIFLLVAFGFLASAFYVTYRPRGRSAQRIDDDKAPLAKRGGRRWDIMKLNKIILWAAVVILVVFLFFPQAVTNLFATGDELTAEMDRTVVKIEGMTWHTWAPKAEQAIKSVPGVLAVQVDYEAGQATIGIKRGAEVPETAILQALEAIKYRGEFLKD